MSQLAALRALSTVVADTGDIEAIKTYLPQDATTNPSLILKACQLPAYQKLIAEAVAQAEAETGSLVSAPLYVAVAFGCAILDIVPGRVSTEVDADLSFNTAATVAQAEQIIALYEARGYDRSRVLIKIAATWEGIAAAKILEASGIHCNVTLIFHLAQAIACADAGVTLISPFVGRIYDWYRAKTGENYVGADDPGVQSVCRIYQYFRHFDIPTIVMGASFRNIGQIQALAGCDYLTISPNLLAELDASTAALSPALVADEAKQCEVTRQVMDETAFRWALNQDPMATEKLAEGIRLFSQDLEKLRRVLQQ